MEKYQEFIRDWSDIHGGDVCQTCKEASAEMVKRFSELKQVRGHVVMVGAPDGDKRPWPHWWCVAEDGLIVDPTREQFPCSSLEYTPIDESRTLVGKCMHCGGVVYAETGTAPFCSEKCERETRTFMCCG